MYVRIVVVSMTERMGVADFVPIIVGVLFALKG